MLIGFFDCSNWKKQNGLRVAGQNELPDEENDKRCENQPVVALSYESPRGDNDSPSFFL
jgi:hypothetical protein